MKENNIKDREKHNGYYNYDTWQLILELDNNYNNYQKVISLSGKMLEMSESKLIIFIYNNFKIEGNINFNNIFVPQVYHFIRTINKQ